MLLRKDDPWSPTLDLPDVRNWRVVDASGNSIGFVELVVVDKEKKTLDALLTGANERFSMQDVEIDESVIRLRQSLERVGASEADVQSEQKSFEEAYRDHFPKHYQDESASFEDVREAYEFGRRMALDAHYSGRSFERAEEDIRGEWVAGVRRIPYDRARAAIRYAHRLVHTVDRYEMSGMNRESEQILRPSDLDRERSSDAGAYMVTGSPSQPSRGDRKGS